MASFQQQHVSSSEFMICESCLGPNPYLRMLKDPLGKACKICSRPFVVFKWKPSGASSKDTDSRYKKTEICMTCAKVKNVCQTCLFDMHFGLPVAIRDKSLGDNSALVLQKPKSDINKEYLASVHSHALAKNSIQELYSIDTTGPQQQQSVRVDEKSAPIPARMLASYSRNRSHLCSFYARGECRRGEYCPYRHELPSTERHSQSEQKLVDRYYGVNDRLAEGMMKNAREKYELQRSKSGVDVNKRLVVRGWSGGVGEQQELLKELREKKAGDGIHRVQWDGTVVYIEYKSNQDARNAMKGLRSGLHKNVSVDWAPQKHPQQNKSRPRADEAITAAALEPPRKKTHTDNTLV